MKTIIFGLLITAAVLVSAACNTGDGTAAPTGKVIKSGPAGNNLTVSLSSADGTIRKGKQDFSLAFADSSGKPVEVGAVSLNFFMPAMGSMSAMNNPATFTTTSTPGAYRGQANIEMTGEWQAQINYEGPAGKGKATLPVTAQ